MIAMSLSMQVTETISPVFPMNKEESPPLLVEQPLIFFRRVQASCLPVANQELRPSRTL